MDFEWKIKEPVTCINPHVVEWRCCLDQIKENEKLAKLVSMGVMEREAARKLAEDFDKHIKQVVESATRKHRIFIATPSYKTIGGMVGDLVHALAIHNIPVTRADYRNGIVETEHVFTRMIPHTMCLEGLRCDECFGFSHFDSIRLKGDGWPGYTRLTEVPFYISRIEKEKMKEMSATVHMEVRNYANSIYGKGANLNRSTPAKLTIKNVIFNDPATIVMWSDGTKTVVKAENEPYDPEKGLAMAYVKKHEGNHGNYYNLFRKFLPNKNED